jgi:biopolymer transport protein ExbD
MPRYSRAFSAAFLGCTLVVGCFAAAEPPSSLEVFVRDDGSCTVLSQDVPCNDVGKRLEVAHVPVTDTIVINGSRLATYEIVGAAMYSLQRTGYVHVQFPSK